jgi:hypothetical protein
MMISDKFLFYFGNTIVFFSFFPTAVFFMKRKIVLETLSLFIYVFISSIADIIGLYLINDYEIRTTFQYFFIIFEILVISIMYLTIVNNVYFKLSIKLLALLFVVFYILYLLFSKSFLKTYYYFEPIEAFFIVMYSISYLYEKIKNSDLLNVSENYFFWINSAFLIHFGSTFILVLLTPFFDTADTYNMNILGLYYYVICILFQTILTIGVWKIKPT